jgi:hypothetical protein
MSKRETIKHKEENIKAWRDFVNTGNLKKGIKADDVQQPSTIFPDVFNMSQKDAVYLLKSYLTVSGYKRCDDRFRQFKRRKITGVTTITLKPETLARLRALSIKSRFDSDNYDLLLEYLMDPENELEDYKGDPDIANLQTGLNIREQSELLRARLVLRGATWRFLLSQIDYAFNAGWLACKYLNGKKRTEKIQEQKAESFMDKIKGL